ncbi:hypothetical protein BDR22DRAFT_838018 [Usnea florida]
MPRYLTPKRSGVHRAACLALYRALLQQKHELQLNEHQQSLFREPIRTVFKRNLKLQSPAQISTALKLGYETLQGLYNSVSRQRILHHIFELASPPNAGAQPQDLPSSPQSKASRAQQVPKRALAPYPGARRALDRPFHDLSGRRHVPVLISANRVPFLRIKKPQSPFLSRIIRDTVNTRERRLALAGRLASETLVAEDEDEWDNILRQHFGLDHAGEQPWQREVKLASDKVHQMQVETIQKRVSLSAKMFAIVEQEKALAEEEKLRLRDEKHKTRKASQLARRALTEIEVQERPCSQEQDHSTQHKPAEIQDVPQEGQEEVRQPGTQVEWRKGGHKHFTPDESRLLYEASGRPKTDEERAKIMEARAMRKEEKAAKKAEKIKKKQKAIGASKEKLSSLDKHSVNRQLSSEGQEDLDAKASSLGDPDARVDGTTAYSNSQVPESSLLLEKLEETSGAIPRRSGVRRPSFLKR